MVQAAKLPHLGHCKASCLIMVVTCKAWRMCLTACHVLCALLPWLLHLYFSSISSGVAMSVICPFLRSSLTTFREVSEILKMV